MEKLFTNNINILYTKDIKKAFELVQSIYTNEQLTHSIRTAKILINKDLGEKTIISTLLQKSFSKGLISLEEINQEFGEEVSTLIKECTRVKEVLNTNYNKIDAETLSALVLSIATEIRTLIILIAGLVDELHYLKEKDKQKIFIAKNIYYPLAIKLGISDLGWKLADYSFKLENLGGYNKIKKIVNKTREDRELLIYETKKEIKNLLEGKVKAQVFGRPKNFLAIYEKSKKVSINKMHDIYGIRIICNKEIECYEILGYIHSKYKFIPTAFDDYIAKEGKGVGKKGYQSIHTAIMRGKDIIEIQIRTWTHHLKTESSIYWEYKRLRNKTYDNSLSWERQLIEWQKSIGKENKNKKLIGGKIFIFTPKNEVISLPENASALDFAFAVHTDIGKHVRKAIVNGELVPIETKLKNLDKVEIIIDEKTKLKQNWINFVVSEKAKTKIKKYFGLKNPKKHKEQLNENILKKIKLAECCHPLPGEEVIGVKTTKRKIIIHKKNCLNIQNIKKDQLIEISFGKKEGKTKIEITAIDRLGLLAEILQEIKKQKTNLISTDFKIKKTGYVEATFEIEVKSVKTIEKIIFELEKIPSIQTVIRK